MSKFSDYPKGFYLSNFMVREVIYYTAEKKGNKYTRGWGGPDGKMVGLLTSSMLPNKLSTFDYKWKYFETKEEIIEELKKRNWFKHLSDLLNTKFEGQLK